jgi:hypothetical protein
MIDGMMVLVIGLVLLFAVYGVVIWGAGFFGPR